MLVPRDFEERRQVKLRLLNFGRESSLDYHILMTFIVCRFSLRLGSRREYVFRYRHLFLFLPVVLFIFPAVAKAQPVLDRSPDEGEVNYFPADGVDSATNPPAFIWLPVENVQNWSLQYSRSADFREAETTTVRDIGITHGKAALQVRFLTLENLSFDQSTGFTAEPTGQQAPQFHLRASTEKAAGALRFITVLQLYSTRNNASLPDARRIDAVGGLGIIVGEDLILWRSSEADAVKASCIHSTERWSVRAFNSDKAAKREETF